MRRAREDEDKRERPSADLHQLDESSSWFGKISRAIEPVKLATTTARAMTTTYVYIYIYIYIKASINVVVDRPEEIDAIIRDSVSLSPVYHHCCVVSRVHVATLLGSIRGRLDGKSAEAINNLFIVCSTLGLQKKRRKNWLHACDNIYAAHRDFRMTRGRVDWDWFQARCRLNGGHISLSLSLSL